MPLDDTPWARSKCAFKAIQYMALGIPAVASPVGANRDVIADESSGFLPADERAWLERLDALLADPGLAARIGAEGRRVVESRFALRVLTPILAERLAKLVG
jgi:glycosyltransferase involved in cell wall biosynthesis